MHAFAEFTMFNDIFEIKNRYPRILLGIPILKQIVFQDGR